ncbi:MAG: poly-beta-1,6-N-acetyl-D-glucosamine N-deacetylase PgaB [Gammaproteobacteria bacterium]
MRGVMFVGLWLCLGAAWAASGQSFIVLNYHGVKTDIRGDLDSDQFAVSIDTLVQHFSWLRENEYRVVGIDDLLAARAGVKALPPKAVVLTFDDGEVSFYTHVYPLLRLFHYPALAAIHGIWLDAPVTASVPYGNTKLPRSAFLTWEQLREMKSSGLVEVASHSYAMQSGVRANPQGNELPASTTRVYLAEQRRYETEPEYRTRVRRDLKTNSDLIARQLGAPPRVMIWPYGVYNQSLLEIARDLGMPITMNLVEGTASTEDLAAIPRFIITANLALAGFVDLLSEPRRRQPLRAVQVDLDYVYDASAEQRERNLGRLLDRIKEMRINTVFLQAFADPDGDGNADSLYFPNRRLPMRADLFGRAAWQLKTRAGVNVYAWLPVLAFDIAALADARVQGVGAGASPGRAAYRRLSPFVPQARAAIRDIYEDLAIHASFDGLLFHDDALLTDFEDSQPAALAVYQSQWGLPASVTEIRANPEFAERWARLKTRWLIDFTHELRAVVARQRPQIKTARNLYARVALEPRSEAWFAQNLADFSAHYDVVALMAMPYMEGARRPLEWLDTLFDAVERTPGALDNTLFELQSVDWRKRQALPVADLVRQIDRLLHRGARHVGYYPDDFIHDQPQMTEVKPVLSIADYPYR